MKEEFKEAMPILKALSAHGYKAYFVGGSVRDLLLKRPIGDIDIATSAKPHEVQQIFDKVIPVGIEHGTVMVRHNHESYEVTTFRVDGEYNDFRHPDEVKFVSSIEEDLARRDFTMNAIAMDDEGNLVDPFNGQHAISNAIIETVRCAGERFQEDPLRMMRALRFSSQLGFQVSEKTYEAIVQNKKLLENIAVERIAVEFEKLFQGNDAKKAWHLLINSQMYCHLPVLSRHEDILIKCKELEWMPLTDLSEAISIFYVIKPDVEVEEWVKAWKLSNKVKTKCLRLIKCYHLYKEQEMKWMVYWLGEENLTPFYRVVKILERHSELNLETLEDMHTKLPIHSRKELDLTGDDIKDLFPNLKPGPWIQSFIQNVEYQVVLGNLENKKDVIRKRVQTWNPPVES